MRYYNEDGEKVSIEDYVDEVDGRWYVGVWNERGAQWVSRVLKRGYGLEGLTGCARTSLADVPGIRVFHSRYGAIRAACRAYHLTSLI